MILKSNRFGSSFSVYSTIAIYQETMKQRYDKTIDKHYFALYFDMIGSIDAIKSLTASIIMNEPLSLHSTQSSEDKVYEKWEIELNRGITNKQINNISLNYRLSYKDTALDKGFIHRVMYAEELFFPLTEGRACDYVLVCGENETDMMDKYYGIIDEHSSIPMKPEWSKELYDIAYKETKEQCLENVHIKSTHKNDSNILKSNYKILKKLSDEDIEDFIRYKYNN